MELRKHLATRLSAFVAVGLLALLSAVPANAQPEGQPVGAESPTLSLNLLGMDPDLAFYGQVGVATLTVPVPAGMVPSTLNVFAQLPVNVRTATVTVSQDDRVIARVDVPPGGPAPLVIPLAGARVEDNAVTVLLRSYLMPDEGYCLDPTNPLRLTDATVSFAGVELPFCEVHISNVHKREAFRHHSYLSDIAVGVMAGFGVMGYTLALEFVIAQLDS